jgi:hypothetical protein
MGIEDIFSVLAFFGIPICVSAYLTGLTCREARARHRRVRWYFCFPGAIGATALVVLFIVLGLSLQHGRSDGLFYLFWEFYSGVVLIITLISAVVTVWYCRRKP